MLGKINWVKILICQSEFKSNIIFEYTTIRQAMLHETEGATLYMIKYHELALKCHSCFYIALRYTSGAVKPLWQRMPTVQE